MSVNITLIIPVYNNVETIGTTLDSVIHQTIPFSEVLIIDDGSTDNSKEVILGYIKDNPYIKYIAQENAGVSSARNAGIREAQGEYICFLDADDILFHIMHEMLQRVIRVNSNKKIYHYNFIQEFSSGVKEENHYILSNGCYKGEEFLSKTLTKFSFESKHMVWSYCFNKQHLIENSVFFDENLRIFEDIEFLHRLFKGNVEIVVENIPLVLYKHRLDSSTQIESEEYLKALQKLLETMQDQSISNYQKDYVFQLATKVLNLNDFKLLFKQQKLKNASSIYLKNKVMILKQKIEIKILK